MQGSPHWEISAGYVGALTAEIPFTNLHSDAVSLAVDEALLTVRPRSGAAADAARTHAATGADAHAAGADGPEG